MSEQLQSCPFCDGPVLMSPGFVGAQWEFTHIEPAPEDPCPFTIIGHGHIPRKLAAKWNTRSKEQPCIDTVKRRILHSLEVSERHGE